MGSCPPRPTGQAHPQPASRTARKCSWYFSQSATGSDMAGTNSTKAFTTGRSPPPCGEELEVGVWAPRWFNPAPTPPPWPSPQGGGKSALTIDGQAIGEVCGKI